MINENYCHAAKELARNKTTLAVTEYKIIFFAGSRVSLALIDNLGDF
jgi:hypothetical protein